MGLTGSKLLCIQNSLSPLSAWLQIPSENDPFNTERVSATPSTHESQCHSKLRGTVLLHRRTHTVLYARSIEVQGQHLHVFPWGVFILRD